MTLTFDAIYADGVFRPVRPLAGLAENCTVTVTLTEPPPSAARPFANWVGDMPDDDAADMTRAIRAEFEGINPDDWK